jgi:hypothetical protein
MQQQLIVKYPAIMKAEFEYIFNIILSDFLGLCFCYSNHEHDYVEIVTSDSEKSLKFDTTFFLNASSNWLNSSTLPIIPLENWNPSDDKISVDLVKPSIPIIFGSKGVSKSENCWYVNLDIFGSIFFMISRYEESVRQERDNHNRFPAYASISAKSNFLERPIVDEYVEILWTCIHSLWPKLNRKKRKFKKFITCDVDVPFDPLRLSLFKTARRSASDILKRKSLKLAIQKWKFYFGNKFNIEQPDQCRDMIDWIMTKNEKLGNKVAFYFITESTSNFDLKYNFDSKSMRMLFKNIYDRGHEIGIHPGYECYKNNVLFNKSVLTLKRILDEEGINQDILGGRMHYLRWEPTQTPTLWDTHDIDYDSTLSFAEVSGFRCGTSHEFTMFDLKKRSSFKLKQRPLINMECTIISDAYEGLGNSKEAFERFRNFSDLCKKYDGNYTLLWHNTSLEKPEERALYLQVLNHS